MPCFHLNCMIKSDIAIVILNWNGRKFLEQFLPSVITYSDDAKIIVADNCSTDDSVSFLKNNYPGIQLIELESNTGFTGGYNKALKQITADFYVLLNSDVEVGEGWIQPIIDLMRDDKSIAACQPKIRSFQQKEIFEHAGASGGFIDYLGYPFCRGRVYNNLENDEEQYNEAREIFWATGACMFIRSKVFHEMHGFDTDFFAHMEEIDLCWRMKRAGYKIMVEPKSIVYHVGGGTLPKTNPRKTYFNFRNNLMMLHKNEIAPRVWWILLIRLFLDCLAAIKFLIEGHPADCKAVMKAHLYFYKNFLRRQKLRILSNPDKDQKLNCVYQKNIVLAHYIFAVKKFSDLDHNKFS